MENPQIISTPDLQWLVLPDESITTYTNWDDGRKGDASELVTKVNGDPGLGLGHCDWRLPTIDELRTLIGTEQDPKKGWHWSSSPYVGGSFSAWGVYFYLGNAGINARNFCSYVRLVRTNK